MFRREIFKYPDANEAFGSNKNYPKKCRLCPGMVFKGHGPAQTHRYRSGFHQISQGELARTFILKLEGLRFSMNLGLLAHCNQYAWTLSALRSLFHPVASLEAEGIGCILCVDRYALIAGTSRVDHSAIDHLNTSGHELVRAIAAVSTDCYLNNTKAQGIYNNCIYSHS